uniref:50S ribosomal protein L9, chloroplastic n=1 Tax=Antithamnionella ternifolia TaxID=207919 RepID=A0A4D6WLC8_9FLOR|nr:ribosomal protein L9 [Antithamnionella ternifolia]
MKKNITVIVKQTHDNLGEKGQVLKVSPGYAFNYLLPNNLVELATKGKIKHFNMFTKIANQKKDIVKMEAIKLKNQIQQIKKISIKRKIGQQQQIFGSINEKDIIQKILEQTKSKLDKKQIQIPEIKNTGIFNILIKFIENESCYLQIQIVPENI